MIKEISKKVMSIRVPESIKKQIDAEAKKRYLTPSKLVSVIVEEHYIKTKKS
jgi:hypothetical protein